ncbi:MAG: Xaa-Pro peptidase family protein [bacterium]|nr:Xaa-Pro peptidase family protein [bacterium]
MERIDKLMKLFENKPLDAIFLLKPLNIFYLTGAYVNGVLYIGGERPLLFVRRPKERPLNSSADVVFINSFKDIKPYISRPLSKVGLELDSLPYNTVLRMISTFGIEETVDISNEVRLVRMKKDDVEIEKIKSAGQIVAKVFERLRDVFIPGMSELDLLIELEYFSRKVGNLGVYRMHSFGNEASFSHIIQGESAFSPSYLDAPTGGQGVSEAFPQGASHRKIEPSKPFTVDVMINYDGYIADATRTFIYGDISEEIKDYWGKLTSIYRFLTDLLVPGSVCEDVYLRTVSYVDSLGLGEAFMGVGRDKVKFIGHGVGLEVDEFPFLARGFPLRLEENTVLAVEPKLFSKSFGIMGIEDTFLIEKDGPKSLIPFDKGLIVL